MTGASLPPAVVISDRQYREIRKFFTSLLEIQGLTPEVHGFSLPSLYMVKEARKEMDTQVKVIFVGHHK